MDNVALKDLKVFLAVARTGSLTQASKELYLTSQGISRIIQKLEDSLNAQLFIRSSRGMILTDSGAYFLKYASDTVEQADMILARIADAEQERKHNLHLISAFGILRMVTPDCVLAFQKRHPDITLEYQEYKDSIAEDVFKHTHNAVALSIGGFDEELQQMADIEKLGSCEIKLLVYKGHPLSYRDSVTIEDLRGENLFLEGPEFKIHHLIADRCRQAGFEPNILFNTSGFSLCHKMVREKKGITVTLDFMLKDMPGSNLVAIPFSDGEYTWDYYMLTRCSDEANPAVILWKQHFLEWMDGIRTSVIKR